MEGEYTAEHVMGELRARAGVGGRPMGSPARLEVELRDGHRAWNPASTKRMIYGPAIVTYVLNRDGGVDARVVDAVTVKVENAYSDGHQSERKIVVRSPGGYTEMDDWFDDVVFPHTGDGHGTDSSLGSCYVATIVEADDQALLGVTHEWID